ncbi:DUF6390 family protein [Mycolicibacterium rufum]|uniref:DUF6390 family protein n=1 Tax=Mycolicibacterium rufum TaxID=318424 RepID=A0A9X3BEN1_9MYCO|nr:DUF6390 family protein [Mycolicibacterium rufum]KGI67863.1 hypothetical protein EU78_10870 [Mycolicibacterium rufum]MCV7069594.1 hypothetical protein [Mycolicibacterium rufum]ULP38850.1 DUF6390 family protein [Mycolicibacterium rufum]
MAAPTRQVRAGHALFAQYAYPPNELGYCGPEDSAALLRAGDEMTSVAREFDGAWPYLLAIADAAGIADPLDVEVVLSYWVGGSRLDTVDGRTLLDRLRAAFAGQVTGLLDDLDCRAHVLAHHSFHVFVVYPWVRFLDRDPTTPLHVLQQCRIRWGSVLSVDEEHVVIESRPLVVDEGRVSLGDPAAERVRWSRDGRSLTTAPAVGDVVAAHWDWVCGPLTDADRTALTTATQATLELVNTARNRS